MDTRTLGLMNRRSRRMLGIRPLLAMVLATTAVSLVVQNPVSAAAQDGLRIKNVASATAKPTQADEPQFLVRTARVPIFVDIDLGAAGGTPAVPDDAVDRVVAALDANPRRLITLRFKGGALRFGELTRSTREALLDKKGNEVIDAYNGYMAGQVHGLLASVAKARPGGPVAVQGIPFEGGATAVAPANRAYGPVVEQLSAIVLGGGMMISGSRDEVAMLRRAYPHALAVAGDRAIVFSANGGWRIVTASASLDEHTLAAEDVEEQDLELDDHLSEAMASDSPEGLPGDIDVLGSPSTGEVPSNGAGAESQPLPPDAGGSGSGSGGTTPAGSGGGGGSGGSPGGGGASGGTAGGAVAATDVDEESEDGEVADGTLNADSDSQEDYSDESGADVSETDDPGAGDSDGWDPSDEVDDSVGGDSSADEPIAGGGGDSEGQDAGGDPQDDDGVGNDGDDSGGAGGEDWSSGPATLAGEQTEIVDWESFAQLQSEVDQAPAGATLDLRGRGFMAQPGEDPVYNRGKDIHLLGGHVTGATTADWESLGDGVFVAEVDFSDVPDARMYLLDPASDIRPRLAVFPPAPSTRGAFRLSKHSNFWEMGGNGDVLTNQGVNAAGGIIEGLRITDPVLRAEVDAAIGNINPSWLSVLYHASSNRMGCVSVTGWDAGSGVLSLSDDNALDYQGYCNFALVGSPAFIREPGEYAVSRSSNQVFYRPDSGNPESARIPCVRQAIQLSGGRVVLEGMTLSGTYTAGYPSSLISGSSLCDRVEIRGCHLHSANFGVGADLIEDSVFEWFVDRATAGPDGVEIRRSIIRNAENNSAVLIQTRTGEQTIRRTVIEACLFSMPATAHGNAVSLYKDSWQNATVTGNIFHNCDRAVAFQPDGNAAFRRTFAAEFRFENNLIIADRFVDEISPGQSGFAFNGADDTHLGPGTAQRVALRYNTLVVDRQQFPPDAWVGSGGMTLAKVVCSDLRMEGNIIMGADAPREAENPPNNGHLRAHNLILRTMPDQDYWGLSFGEDDLPSPASLLSAFDFQSYSPLGMYESAAVDGGPVGVRWSRVPARDDLPNLGFDWSVDYQPLPLPGECAFARVYFNQDLR